MNVTFYADVGHRSLFGRNSTGRFNVHLAS